MVAENRELLTRFRHASRQATARERRTRRQQKLKERASQRRRQEQHQLSGGAASGTGFGNSAGVHVGGADSFVGDGQSDAGSSVDVASLLHETDTLLTDFRAKWQI